MQKALLPVTAVASALIVGYVTRQGVEDLTECAHFARITAVAGASLTLIAFQILSASLHANAVKKFGKTN